MNYKHLTKKEGLRKILNFVGPDLATISVASILAGVVLFATESVFAVVLQLFFSAIGLSQLKAVNIPFAEELSRLGVVEVMISLMSVVLLRAGIQWLQNTLQYAACFRFIIKQRKRMLTWAFGSVSPDPGQVVSYFGDYFFNGGIAILQLQIALTSVATAVCMAAVLFYFMPLPTFVALLLLAGLLIPVRSLNKKIKNQGLKVNDDVKNINARLFTGIKNLIFLRLYGLDVKERHALSTDIDKTKDSYLSFYKLSGVTSIAPQILGTIVIVMIVMQMKTQSIAPSLLISYFYIFFRFLQCSSVLVAAMSNFSFYYPSLDATAKWWSLNAHDGVYNPISEDVKTEFLPLRSPKLGMDVKNLSFSYGLSEKPLFENLNFKIPAGSCFVVIGPSGSGKSTLLALILGQLKPQRGHIYIQDGEAEAHDVEQVKKDYFQKIAYVGPDPFLVTGSIRDNLLYGLQVKVSDEKLFEVLREVEGKFVFELKEGLNHHITYQGEGLSSGQKQRIALARALLRQPSILVLDEATANLDSETEDSLVHKLQSLKGKMTMLVVTHRQSLLVLADHVLDLGKLKSTPLLMNVKEL